MTTNYSYTLNYNFSIPRYDTQLWHGAMKDNLKLIDALIAALGLPVVSGIWQNSTSYAVGARAFDTSNSTIYEAQVAHTSASSGTFLADRTANPTYWTAVTAVITWRGAWAASTQYYVRDVVREGHIYYQANTSHVSSASFATDSANWETVVDLSTSVTAAQAAQTAAEAAQTAAETAETNAETAQTAAEAAQTAAETAQTGAETAETNAETAETNAETAQTAAETAQTAAETAQTAAETAQAAAETAETGAEAALETFQSHYLGAAASDPTVDNNGDPLSGGELYFNIGSLVARIYDSGTATWYDVGQSTSPVPDGFTGDGSTAGFTLSTAPANENFTLVYIDGVYQHKDVYSVSGTTLTFSSAPYSGADIEVITLVATDIGTPSSNTVGTNQLNDAEKPEIRGWLDLDLLRGYNQIINGDFLFWQRATSQTSSGYDSNDRWTNRHSGSTKTTSRQTFTLGQTDVPGNPKYYSRTVVTSSAGASNYVIQTQRIEGVGTLAGKTATLTFYAKADSTKNIATSFTQRFGTTGSPSSDVTGIEATTHALTTSWQKFSVTVDIPSISGKTLGTDNNDNLDLFFWFDAGSDFDAQNNSLGQQSGTFDIAHVSLVEGDATNEDDPFSPRHIQQEFALCKRYYERMPGYNFAGFCATGTSAFAAIKYLPKRATPTLSTSTSSAKVRNQASAASSPLITSLSFFDIKEEGTVLAQATVASGLTAGAGAVFQGNSDYLEIDAEL